MTPLRPIPCAGQYWAVEHYIEHAFWEAVETFYGPYAADRAIIRARLDRSDGIEARAKPVVYGPRRGNPVFEVEDGRSVFVGYR